MCIAPKRLCLNYLKINSPSHLLFARMFTVRVTNSTIRIFVQFFFLSECLLSSTGYLSGNTDSVTDETESDYDQGGFLRHGNTS